VKGTNIVFTLAALAGVSALGAAAVRAEAPPATNAASTPLGAQAPAFTAHTLDGRPVATSAFAGKVLVLNFWATWCPPCRAETADLVKAFHALHAPDVAFLGVDTTETAPVVRTFVAARGVPYATALAGPDVYNNYGIAFIPTTIVVDAKGVVRARWTGGVSPEQLRQFVAGARKGESVVFVSSQQQHIDALLDPAQFTFGGDAASVHAVAAAAVAKVKDADQYVASLPASNSIAFDDERTMREEGALLETAGNAAKSAATTDDDKLAADAILADAYADLNRFGDAAQTYRDALQLKPNDPALTMGLARSYYRLHDYDQMAVAARAYIALLPNDPDGYDSLGLAFQRSRHFAEAVAPYEKAVALMIAAEKAAPPDKRGDAAGVVADESLDLGDVYVSLGDAAGARRTFASAAHYAALIPKSSEYAGLRDRVPDRAAEGMAALGLAHGDATTLALSKWTGADLPGSLKSTYKYRLIVVAPARKPVTLTTRGLKPGWVASFCAAGLCSPRTVSYVSPEAGVKTYEFQLVPPDAHAAAGHVSVIAGSAEAEVP
jgi:cytochrome c biogenesis protein CcmG/thiol:disulfide interchange protein DsbE